MVNPAHRLRGRRDVVVEDGKISALPLSKDAQNDRQASDVILDAENCLVMPGLVDLHVHLRQPGMTAAEDLVSGTRAAAAGGFTTIVCQPNTKPVLDHPRLLQKLNADIRSLALVRVIASAALSVGLRGQSLSPLADLAKAGAGALSDDGVGTRDPRLLRSALRAAQDLDLTVLVHCEDHEQSAGGVMTAGVVARRLGLAGIPAAAERLATQRAIGALRRAGGRLHIQHVSTVGALAAIRRAKAEGLPVSCEVTPHHLFLTAQDIEIRAQGAGPDSNLKMNPPLRSRRDLEALRRGLTDGSIDAIATDHAPHTRAAKALGFVKAPFGVTGMETALSLTLRLVNEGVLTLNQAISLLTVGPARLLQLPAGVLRPGAPADLTVVDPKKNWRVVPAKMKSRSRNTSFSGWEMPGKVKWTIVGGKIVIGSGSGTRR